jgi:hypothetical protein
VNDEIAAHVVVDDPAVSGQGRLTVLGLSWRRDDPLAVVLTLAAQPDHPALPRGSWAVLRDFLRYGLEEPTGDGAVRIRPDGDGHAVLELVGSHKPYAVRVARQVLADFLDATERVVPSGAAAEDEVMAALIERLLEY